MELVSRFRGQLDSFQPPRGWKGFLILGYFTSVIITVSCLLAKAPLNDRSHPSHFREGEELTYCMFLSAHLGKTDVESSRKQFIVRRRTWPSQLLTLEAQESIEDKKIHFCICPSSRNILKYLQMVEDGRGQKKKEKFCHARPTFALLLCWINQESIPAQIFVATGQEENFCIKLSSSWGQKSCWLLVRAPMFVYNLHTVPGFLLTLSQKWEPLEPPAGFHFGGMYFREQFFFFQR